MKHVSKEKAQDLFSWGRKASRKVSPTECLEKYLGQEEYKQLLGFKEEYDENDGWRHVDQGYAYQLIAYSCMYLEYKHIANKKEQEDSLEFLKLVRNKINKAIRKYNRKK